MGPELEDELILPLDSELEEELVLPLDVESEEELILSLEDEAFRSLQDDFFADELNQLEDGLDHHEEKTEERSWSLER